MMYPHTITIYNHQIVNGADTYKKWVLSGVYWHSDDILALSGKGVTEDLGVSIEIPKNYADTFDIDWYCKKGDRIVKGIGQDIESFKDLVNAVSVTAISDNRCGSRLDCITIKGK